MNKNDDLTFVVVLYNMKYKDSNSLKSLINNGIFFNQILVIDNSTNQDLLDYNYLGSNCKFRYISMNANVGISKAYNKAIENVNTTWVVFLDQDTQINSDYINEVHNIIKNEKEIKAYCPIVKCNNLIVSPAIMKKYRTKTFFNEREIKAVKGKKITFINSGVLINTDIFKAIGRYDEGIFLDFVDHDFSDRYFKEFGVVKIMNSKINHNLSTLNHNCIETALKRFEIYLKDFKSFIKKKEKNMIMYKLIIIYRAIRLSYIYKSTKFIKIIGGTK